MPTPRTVLGPKLDKFSRAALVAGVLAVAPVEEAPLKVDPVPAFRDVDKDAEPLAFHFQVPAYDEASSNVLTKIRVVVVPDGHGEPDSVEGWLASDYPHGETDTSAIRAGGPATVEVANIPDGDFGGQVLLTYDN